MGRKIDKVTGEMKYYIPVDFKYYETSEEVYRTYFKMVNQELHQEKMQLKYESSYNELEENGFQIECHSSVSKKSAEDDAITAVMIEAMLNKLSILNDYELWLIQELYTHGKTFRQIEEESGIKKSTVWEQKEKILAKLRKELEG